MVVEDEGKQGQDGFLLSEHKFAVNRLLAALAVQCAAQTADLLGLERSGRYNLEMAVEEGFINAVDHYSAVPGPGEHILLRFTVEPGKLVVSLREKGIPFSREAQEEPREILPGSLEELQQPGLGMRLMRGAMDGVCLISHGREGKELRLEKNLDPQRLPRAVLELLNPPVDRARRRTAVNPQVLLAREEDVPGVCRLAWRCYNYTQDSVLYIPDKLQHKLRSGEIVMFIAKSGDGSGGSEEIIYHLALKYADPALRVPEVGYAFSDPGWRCGDLTAQMGEAAYAHAKTCGDRGVFSRCISNHIYSQRGTQQLGSYPCSVHYGIAPEGMSHKVPGATAQEKGSTVNFYLAFDRSPDTVYIPPQHQEMVRKIYGWLELPREFGQVAGEIAPGKSEVVYEPLSQEYRAAHIIVTQIGPDTFGEIMHYRKQALQEKLDATYLFLPADNPATPELVRLAEEEGYSFAGIMPHIHGGSDRLLMQQLNITLDLDKILAYGTEGQELAAYVRAEYEKQL